MTGPATDGSVGAEQGGILRAVDATALTAALAVVAAVVGILLQRRSRAHA